MESIKVYKDRAVESLSGNWGNGALAVLVMWLIVCVPVYILNYAICNGIGSLWEIAMIPLIYGAMVMFLDVARGEKAKVGMIFCGKEDYWRIFTTMLLSNIYLLLWSLLLIVPGIIKSYSYAMVPFILKDYSGMRNNYVIEESMMMMKGHKMKLFLLDLSMIGWAILSIFTLGIGFLFLVPYMYTAHAHFYEDRKREIAEAFEEEEARERELEREGMLK